MRIRSFYTDRYEVTNGQYCEFLNDGQSQHSNDQQEIEPAGYTGVLSRAGQTTQAGNYMIPKDAPAAEVPARLPSSRSADSLKSPAARRKPNRPSPYTR